MKATKGWVLGLALTVGGVCGAQASASYLSPEYLASAPDGKALYVTAATAGKLLIVDPATSKISGDCSIKGGPSGVAVAPDGTVFVTEVE